jgi:ATP-dependent Clp protease ATP-binding subunit ClpA
MTWEELIVKAEEHAEAAGVPAEQLQQPKVRETALVTFRRKGSVATARFHLDSVTGELISAVFSGPDAGPRTTGKQFSKSAQRVLALASEESRRVGCDHVGSDHLLLALLVYGEGRAAAMLLSAGLSAEAVRHRIATIGSAAEVPSNGYGPSIRSVLRLSSQHAETLGASELEPEHFALGLLDKADGPAMSLLRHFTVDTERLKTSLLTFMKTACMLILSGLVLCGCSQEQASSAGPAIDLVRAGKDTTWSNGYVLHVTKRDGASLEGVTISAKLPNGQTQAFSADTATLSGVPNATDDSSVMVTLHGAKMGGVTVGEYPIALHK